MVTRATTKIVAITSSRMARRTVLVSLPVNKVANRVSVQLLTLLTMKLRGINASVWDSLRPGLTGANANWPALW